MTGLRGLCMSNSVENSQCPAIIVGADNKDAKTMRFALHPNPFRVINVQINTKSRGKLRGQA